MTVAWKQTALDDRAGLLARALDRAIDASDPQVYAAALDRDDRIEAEGDALDGVATYLQGPLPDSRLYPTGDGLFVILYRRDGDTVEIERVFHSRSNWKPTR